MKRKGGAGGRTNMVFGMNDPERKANASMGMEDLCSKLTSLLPQDYQLDAIQGPPDIPSQLMQAAAYIQDLRERVERLKQMRDDRNQRMAGRSCSNVMNPQGAGSCCPQDIKVEFSGATHFDVTFTTSSAKRIEMHKVIRVIHQDRCMEVVEASWCFVDGSKVFYMIKCKAISSESAFDASMVATRLRRLLTDSLAEPGSHGV